MSGNLSSVEGELNAIIKEFLEFSNLSNTLKIFEEECQKMGKPIQDHGGKGRRDERISKIKNELLRHFDNGNRTEFFCMWETNLNADVKENNPLCHKLEFYVHVHFAILPMRKLDHWSKEEVEEAMVHFHFYLETRGSALSSCAELLPFYALPYVPQPVSHPSFAEVFKELWVVDLRNKLENFLWEGLKQNRDELENPKLVELYHNKDLDLQDARKELDYLEKRLLESEKRSVSHVKKCEKLQEDCQQLMSVSSLLVTALESAVKGNMVDMDCVLSSCTTHLPEMCKLRNESTDVLQESSILKDFTEPLKSSSYMQTPDEKQMFLSLNLNYSKVKEDICSSEEKKQLLLLQALRWRMMKVGSWCQQETVVEFVKNDLFQLHNTPEDQTNVLQMIRSSKGLLLQCSMQLLNAFSSFVLGREYLTSNPNLLHMLLEHLLMIQPKADFTLDMILGTLKKLSVRRVSQTTMIDSGVIEWIANALESKVTISEYALASSIALLFNLSLNPMGKERCEPLKEILISSLSKLLHHPDAKIAPYVNGILFRVLSIPSVKEYAKEQQLPSAVKNMMQKSEGELKKQLETILELFLTDLQIEDSSSDDEDDDQDDMSLESEIDFYDSVKAEDGELYGEELLSRYCTSNTDIDDVDKWNSNNSVLSRESIGTGVLDVMKISSLPEETFSPSIIQGDSNFAPHPQMNISSPLVHKDVLNQALSEPSTPKLDVEATELVRKIVGPTSTTLVEAAVVPDPASVSIKGLNANEYTVAFSSRPKIPRTPEPGEVMSPKIDACSPMLTRSQRLPKELINSSGGHAQMLLYCHE